MGYADIGGSVGQVWFVGFLVIYDSGVLVGYLLQECAYTE
jgi:hypothetical protein